MKNKQILVLGTLCFLIGSIRGQQSYNDPFYSDQYYHKLVQANRLNEFPMVDHATADGRTIVIAVVDESLNINTSDVNWYKNVNEIANNSIDDDNNGYVDDYDGWIADLGHDNFGTPTAGFHGINICGIIGAIANNNSGCVGIAPGIKILPVVGGSAMNAGLLYVLEQRKLYNSTNGAKGAFIVACNLSQEFNNNAKCSTVNALFNAGVIVVCGTGSQMLQIVVETENASGKKHSFPTSCTGLSSKMISVGGSNEFDCRARFSPNNHKESEDENRYDDLSAGSDKGTDQSPVLIHVVAPAENIVSLEDDDPDANQNGNSFAAPQVAALVGLVYDVICRDNFNNVMSNPSELATLVRGLILNSAYMPVYGKIHMTCDKGRIDVYRTLLNSIYAYNIPENLSLLNQTLVATEKYYARSTVEITNCTIPNNVDCKAGAAINLNAENIIDPNCEFTINDKLSNCSVGSISFRAFLTGPPFGLCAINNPFPFHVEHYGGKAPFHYAWVVKNASGTVIADFLEDDLQGAFFDFSTISGTNLKMECTITDALNTTLVVTKNINCLLGQSPPIFTPNNKIVKIEDGMGVTLFPNPATDIVNLISNIDQGQIETTLFTTAGKIISHFNFCGSYIIYLKDISDGIYLLKFDGINYHETRKIVINH